MRKLLTAMSAIVLLVTALTVSPLSATKAFANQYPVAAKDYDNQGHWAYMSGQFYANGTSITGISSPNIYYTDTNGTVYTCGSYYWENYPTQAVLWCNITLADGQTVYPRVRIYASGYWYQYQ